MWVYTVCYANSNSVSMAGELNDLSGFPSLVFLILKYNNRYIAMT